MEAVIEPPIAVKFQHASVYCEDCKKPIIKKRNQSWRDYGNRRFCDRTCLARNQVKIQTEAKAVRQLPDGTIMPIGKYLEVETDNGRLQANFYVGVMKKVDEHNEADGSGTVCPKCQNVFYSYYYKGLLITTELAKTAADWLTMNTFGRYGQRKAPDEAIKRSESELVERLRYLVKKVVKKEVVADKILVLLGEAGL